jgi:hypothetical protein
VHTIDKDTWVDQANTVWTGVELGFASFLLYEGMYAEAMKVIRNVDQRYRHWGMYWDHQEFGGHYFRPMSAWAIVNGLLGLSVNDGRYTFDPKVPGAKVKLFFAFCDGYGHYERVVKKSGDDISIAIASGEWRCRELVLGTKRTRVGTVLVNGRKAAWSLDGGRVRVKLGDGVVVKAGKRLHVTLGSQTR